MKKREKELARAQKQRDKAAKRLMRKNGELTSPSDEDQPQDIDGQLDASDAESGEAAEAENEAAPRPFPAT